MSAEVILLRRRAMPIDLTDRALVGACAVGEGDALAVLFDRHHRALYAVLGRIALRGGADVEDLVQQTFIHAWKLAADFRGDCSVRTWLTGIALNLSRNAARAHERRRGFLARLLWLSSDRAPPLDEAAIDRRRLVSRIEAALAELPHDLRAAFVLCEVEGLSGKEAAQILGVRPGTVWRRIHQARKRLRAELGEES